VDENCSELHKLALVLFSHRSLRWAGLQSRGTWIGRKLNAQQKEANRRKREEERRGRERDGEWGRGEREEARERGRKIKTEGGGRETLIFRVKHARAGTGSGSTCLGVKQAKVARTSPSMLVPDSARADTARSPRGVMPLCRAQHWSREDTDMMFIALLMRSAPPNAVSPGTRAILRPVC
jgi:hypothetical protein